MKEWTLDKKPEVKGVESAAISASTKLISSSSHKNQLSNALISGNLSLSAPATINCQIEGNIDSNSELVIGSQAKISGNITAPNIVLHGSVYGNLDASDTLTLKTGSSLRGDLKCSRLIIEDGVVFEGYCDMQCAPTGLRKFASPS